MPVITLKNPPSTSSGTKGRPPKKWWKDCTDGVRKSSRKSRRPYSPEDVCGSLWYHKMSTKQRKAATKRHEKGAKLSLNPSSKWYVGNRSGQYIMFQSATVPTEQSHGNLCSYAIGPFRTRLGATIMARHGKGNPHLQTVADAERYAAKGVSWLLANGFHV